MEETKEYFEKYILMPVTRILYNQRIYKDFQKICISKGFKVDPFTNFVDINYYKVMITDLCKLLDKKKQKGDKNFRDFIELFKSNEAVILEKRSKKNIISLSSKTVKEVNVKNTIKPLFDNTEHDKKIKELEENFKVFQAYRNKINCHQTSEEVFPPNKENIDKTISLLEELLNIYAKLFGICLLEKIPPIYLNPPMNDISALK